MTDNFQFKPEAYQLRWPVKKLDGTEINQVSIGMIYHHQHSEILADDPTETVAFRRLVKISCGLSDDEIDQIKRPDWNSLCLKISDLVSKSSAFFFKQHDIKFVVDAPRLLVPINGDDGNPITLIQLTVPSVKTTELMEKQPDANARSLFITMACSGLTEHQINRLAVPDWTHLQERINDFLNETADSFQSETPTS
jgi:hypothetical protein